ncbi:MAG: serine protease [Proteobacteria bacterium]|nr:MAG: serine protease [Pseudomonadota bacterium]
MILRMLSANGLKALPLFLILLSACHTQESSTLKTFFGTHDIQILEDKDLTTNIDHSVGAVYIMTVDEQGKSLAINKFCSGIQIGPRFVLTNAHCVKMKSATAYVDLYFSKDFIALEGEGQKPVKAVDLAGNLYLQFDGKTKMDEKPTKGLSANLEVRYVSKTLDFALLALTDDFCDRTYMDMNLIEAPAIGQALTLLSYPNDMPLTRSTNCSVEALVPNEMKHTCDSAGGSSAGLLMSASTGAPVGLHRQGVFENSTAFFNEHGRSETTVELAERECAEKYKIEVGTEKFAECVKVRSATFLFNRGIPLKDIQAELNAQGFGADVINAN